MKNFVLGVLAGLQALVLAPAMASAQTGALSVLDANGAKQHLCEVIDGAGNLYACNTLWGLTGSLPNYVTVETNHSLDETVVNFPSGFYAYQPDSLASGSIAAATLNAAYTVSLANAEGVVGLNLSGLTASGATLTAEAADNSSNWYPINLFSSVAGTPSTTATQDGNYKVNASGHSSVRLRVSTVGMGSIAVASVASSVSSMVTEANSSAISASAASVATSGATTATNTGTTATNTGTTATNTSTIATAQGASGTGITQPTGGSGILGWLSGIYNTLANVGIKVFGAETAGSTPTGGGVRMMGSDGTYARDLTTDVNGRLALSPTNGSGSASAPIYMQGAGSTTLMGSIEGNVAPGATSGTNTPLNFGGWSAVTSGVPSGTFDNVQVSPSGAMSTTQAQNTLYTETTTTLGASSAYTGSAHNLPAWATYFTATFFADQASGTNGAEIDCSQDSSTWTIEATATLTASTPAILSVPAVCTYQRVKETNGSTAQTSVNRVYSSFTGG